MQAGSSTLLTVTVTPGLNPASTGIGVTADLTAIGGSASQQFFDDGTHGDVAANDNIFSFQATVPANTLSGGKTLAGLRHRRAIPQRERIHRAHRDAPHALRPPATGSANPNSLQAGASTLLTVSVAGGTNPPSTGLAVTADLSLIGGSAAQQFFDNGTNGDVTADDNIFSFLRHREQRHRSRDQIPAGDHQRRPGAHRQRVDFAYGAVSARAEHRQDQPGLRRRR